MRGNMETLHSLLSSYGTLLYLDTLIKDKSYRFQNAIAIFKDEVCMPPAGTNKRSIVVAQRKLKITHLSQRRNCSVLLALLHKKLKLSQAGGFSCRNHQMPNVCFSKGARYDGNSAEPSLQDYQGTHSSQRIHFSQDEQVFEVYDHPDPFTRDNYWRSSHALLPRGICYYPRFVAHEEVLKTPELQFSHLNHQPSLGPFSMRSKGYNEHLSPAFLDLVAHNHRRANIRINC